MNNQHDKVGEFAEILKSCGPICFFTGAGISTESGIPDFRSPGGIWSKYRIIQFQEFLESEQARLEDWRRRFDMASVFDEAEPNKAHIWISKLVATGKATGVITQNIDNLHQRSGIDDDKIVTFHGTGGHAHCLNCGALYEIKEMRKRIEEYKTSPECFCGGLIKSAVVSFGETIPHTHMENAVSMIDRSDILIVIGSSLSVWPAAGLIDYGVNQGKDIIIINKTETDFDKKARLTLHENAGEIVGSLDVLSE